MQITNRLAEKPLLAAADSGLLLAEAAGLKPDWITGDMDSLVNVDILSSYQAEQLIRHTAEKDYTDTELALTLLWEKGCDETWIIGGGGGRLDHLLGIRDLFEREPFPRRWITANEDVYCIDSMEKNSLTVKLEPGAIVSVFPLGGDPWQAESYGLKWPLDTVYWKRGLYGLSNVAVNGEFSIMVKAGRFMIILPWYIK